MCNPQCIEFVSSSLSRHDVEARRVLEVGALDVNGSVRPYIEKLEPADYVGVDLVSGSGVDAVCRAEELVSQFGEGTFDVVVATELLEHVADWRSAVHNFKSVVTPGGIVVLTTRSLGSPFHGYPDDYWRFEPNDLRVIFADCHIDRLDRDDPGDPGVFLKVVVPPGVANLDLSGYAVHSMLVGRRLVSVEEAERLLALERAVAEGEERLRLERHRTSELTANLASLEADRQELARLRETKTMRYTAWLRRAYGWLLSGKRS